MKKWLPWIGLTASLLAAAYFIRAISRHWTSLSHVTWDSKTLLATLSAMALYAMTYAAATRAWQLELRSLNFERSYRALSRIVLTAQFAKYLPGNVGHHVGRVVMAKQAGLPTDSVVLSMVIDTVLVISAGAAGTFPAWPLLVEVLSKRGDQAATWPLALVAVSALLVVAGSFVVPAVRDRVTGILTRGGPSTSGKLRLFGVAWLSQCFCFVLGASSLYVLCYVASTMQLPWPALNWMSVLGVYSAAWLLGFLMPGAPAGLGVREFVLLLGLSPLVGEQSAVVATLILRFATTLTDGLLFAIALYARRLKREEHA